MIQRWFTIGWLVTAALATSSSISAQGVQTGTITGIVNSIDGLPLEGVAVTATSPALLGERAARSDVNGVYVVRGLVAATYTIRFDLPAFHTATSEDVVVNVGGVTALNVTMALAARTETVTVTADTPSTLTMPGVSHGLNKAQIDALPIGRRPLDLAELSPNVTNNAFTAGQVAIAGAFGYDNVFMIDGVDVNDTLFSTANNLFIEDAIQEASVLSSGISAEYGRFSGGVVNIVTKTGSNRFSGSFRENLSNPSWIDETPRQDTAGIANPDILGNIHEGTLGGPIVRDRLWFFAAGRGENTSTANALAQSGRPYTRADTNRRGEIKLTGRLRMADSLQGTFINNSTEQANASGVGAASIADSRVLVTRQLPNRLFALNYNSVVRSSAFVTLQYSQKVQEFRNNGGTSLTVADSPFRTIAISPGVPNGLWYRAPVLDANDPERRNNRQLTGSITRQLSTRNTGTHDLKVGAEYFVTTGVGGNGQSSTGYIFATDYLTQGGAPVLDAHGSPIPRFIPGASELWNYRSTPGATIDIDTLSVYGQDQWMASPRLTLDLGVRFESVRSDATGGITTVDASTVAPRLGATFDVMGSGKTVLQGTYGHYAGKYGQVQFSSNTNVGRPSEVDYVYVGPPGQGADFAPGFDPANYRGVVFASFPTANVRMDDDLRSPLTREFTLSVGHQIGQRSSARATYVWRHTTHLVEDFADLSSGTVSVPDVGVLTYRILGNSDGPVRRYQALVFQGDHRLGPWATIRGHYTVQLRNHGNFVGESANVPGASTLYGNFPEIYGPALDRLMPEGRFDSFQRHKLRIFGTVSKSMGRFGTVDVAPIWRVNSGTAYSLSASTRLTAVQLSRNPGYPANDINPSVRQTVFFGERGEHLFKGSGLMDVAATYSLPVWRTVAPWFKLEVYNLFNNQKQIGWDRTVSINSTSPVDGNGIPTGYIQGPNFGRATSDTHFPQAFPGQNGGRAMRLAFGVRF